MAIRNPQPIRSLNPADEAMRRLLMDTCYVQGYGEVPWGAMTADLHQIRAAYLERRRDMFITGINATIRRHNFAAGLLTESGCADLNAYADRYGRLPDEIVLPEKEEKIPA